MAISFTGGAFLFMLHDSFLNGKDCYTFMFADDCKLNKQDRGRPGKEVR
ncbi:hypothetical protein IMSAG013_01256 [Clostridiales bacterium]|jgi:hypothetical protein|nr:hypothetical protein IMSAG013_01256 [Clostridiales bacterium]